MASKTQTFDDTVIFDKPAFSSNILKQQWALIGGRADPVRPFWQENVGLMLGDWRKVWKILGHPQMNRYQLRHGGASHALLTKERSASEISG